MIFTQITAAKDRLYALGTDGCVYKFNDYWDSNFENWTKLSSTIYHAAAVPDVPSDPLAAPASHPEQ